MSPSPSAPDVESPSSPTTTRPAVPASVPTSSLFLPPKGPAAPLPPPSPSSSTSSPDSPSSLQGDAGEAPTWSGDYADSEARSEKSEPSGTPSTGSGLSVSRAGLRAAIGQGLRTVTRVISRIAATPVEQQYGVWRADAEDIEEISKPAARVIWRRLPEEARGSDTVDLVVLALAVVGYVAKHLDTKWELRRAMAAGEVPDLADAGDELAAAAATGP
jgi:hypothetical protein